MSAAPAKGDVVFTDLGPTGDVYNGFTGWVLFGNAFSNTGSWTQANFFTASGAGNLAVSEIDLAVIGGPQSLNTFYASIWTDSAGTPGAEVPGGYWSLLSTRYAAAPLCCGLVSVTGITGVHLTGGQSYFLVLGPVSTADASDNYIAANNQGVTGLDLFSTDGGSTWNNENGIVFTGAFDVIAATPEPGYVLLVGIGVAGIMKSPDARNHRNQEEDA